MESQSSPAPRVRNGAAPETRTAAWRPATGIIDRMLAYRDWWNIPEGRSRTAPRGRTAPDRNRARPQAASEGKPAAS